LESQLHDPEAIVSFLPLALILDIAEEDEEEAERLGATNNRPGDDMGEPDEIEHLEGLKRRFFNGDGAHDGSCRAFQPARGLRRFLTRSARRRRKMFCMPSLRISAKRWSWVVLNRLTSFRNRSAPLAVTGSWKYECSRERRADLFLSLGFGVLKIFI
jgi:hypothetical protein